MTTDEITKRGFEAYPDRYTTCNYPYNRTPDLNKEKREGYIRALTEIEELPKIKGWVARHRDGELCLFSNEPIHKTYLGWLDEHQHWRVINPDYFPELTYKSKPIEVELIIRPVNSK